MRILSINIWDLPLFTKDASMRIGRLISFIRQEKPDYVCIQESWRTSTRNRILTALPEYITVPECRTSFLNHDRSGGLFLLTKKTISILQSHFSQFTKKGRALEERLAGKGFLHTVVVQGGKTWNLITTHLHFRHTCGTSAEIRQQQLNQIFIYAEKLTTPIILTGDLNISQSSTLYKTIIKQNFVDCAGQTPMHTYNPDNPYSKAYFNRFLAPKNAERLDYVFLKQTLPEYACTSTRIVFTTPETLVSDHYGVFAEIL